MNKLFITIGIAGSGKSTIAAMIARQEKSIILSSDSIRGMILGDENNQAEGDLVFAYLRNSLTFFLQKGKNVIIDATNLTPERRQWFIAEGKKFGYKTVAVNVPTELELCHKRNYSRARVVPEKVLNDQHARLKLSEVREFDMDYYFYSDGEFILWDAGNQENGSWSKDKGYTVIYSEE
jgi:predicted kinase